MQKKTWRRVTEMVLQLLRPPQLQRTLSSPKVRKKTMTMTQGSSMRLRIPMVDSTAGAFLFFFALTSPFAGEAAALAVDSFLCDL